MLSFLLNLIFWRNIVFWTSFSFSKFLIFEATFWPHKPNSELGLSLCLSLLKKGCKVFRQRRKEVVVCDGKVVSFNWAGWHRSLLLERKESSALSFLAVFRYRVGQIDIFARVTRDWFRRHWSYIDSDFIWGIWLLRKFFG